MNPGRAIYPHRERIMREPTTELVGTNGKPIVVNSNDVEAAIAAGCKRKPLPKAEKYGKGKAKAAATQPEKVPEQESTEEK